MRNEDRSKKPSGQPPRFEDQDRDDAGLGAEARGYEPINKTRDRPYQGRGQQRPNWDNDLMPRDPDPSPNGADGGVPADQRDHDRAYGWSGGRGKERSARERELTELDADAARTGETQESSSEERRDDDPTPEDPDSGETERNDTEPR